MRKSCAEVHSDFGYSWLAFRPGAGPAPILSPWPYLPVAGIKAFIPATGEELPLSTVPSWECGQIDNRRSSSEAGRVKFNSISTTGTSSTPRLGVDLQFGALGGNTSLQIMNDQKLFRSVDTKEKGNRIGLFHKGFVFDLVH